MYYKSCFLLKLYIKDEKYSFKNINIINCNNKNVSELYTSKYNGSQNYCYRKMYYNPYSLDFNDNRKYKCKILKSGNQCLNCINCLLNKLNNIFLANKINFIFYESNSIKKENNFLIFDIIVNPTIINRNTNKKINYNILHIIDNRFNLQNNYNKIKFTNCVFIDDISFDNIFNIVIEYAKNNNLLIPIGIKSSRK